MKQKILVLAVAGLLAGGPTLAEETLETVTVTASRSLETVDASLATVSVITREDIERLQAQDLLDVLRREAGVDLARSGGPGSAGSLFLRGTNSNQTLVLVDGVRVSAFPTGALDLSSVPISQVERIEIVRGPRAAYWGSDAIGGVVQVFTRRLEGPMLSAQVGSFGTRRGQAGWGGRSGPVRLGIVLAEERADGISAQNPDGFNFHPDDDGYHQRSLGLSGGIDLGSHSLALRGFRSESDVEFDSAAPADQPDPAESAGVLQTVSAQLTGPLAERWQHHLTLARARGDLDTPTSDSSFRTRRLALDWQNTLQLTQGQVLLFGVNLLDEEGFASDGFNAPYGGERDNRAGYLGWRAGAGALDAEVVGRHDDYSGFGGEFSGSASLGWRASDRVRFTSSFGEGFRAPNLNELFSPGSGGFFAGNPLLDPERSRSLEVGADLTHADAGTLRLRGFRTNVRDLISFTGGGVAEAENIARARIDGVEAEYDWRRDGWMLQASATWQDPRNLDTGAQLLRRPSRKGALGVDHAWEGGFSLGAQALLVGNREDFGFPDNERLGGYALLNLRAAWTITPDWTLELRGDNVLDRDYTEVFGFNTPGRAAFLGVRWQPGG